MSAQPATPTTPAPAQALALALTPAQQQAALSSLFQALGAAPHAFDFFAIQR